MSNIPHESLAQLARLKHELGSPSPEELREQLAVQLPNLYLFMSDENRYNAVPEEFHESTWGDYDLEGIVSSESPKAGPTLDRVRGNQALVEYMDMERQARPLTVCIPFRLGESMATTERLLQQISKAAERTQGGIEVLIWANAQYSANQNDGLATAQATADYEVLCETLHTYRSEHASIMTALDMIEKPIGKFSMSRLRGNFMDAQVGRVIDGEIPIEQPVLWIDADTTYIGPTAFENVRNELTERVFGFCHTDIDYSVEWASGMGSSETDYASRVLQADELVRRAVKRAAITQGVIVHDRVYPEEGGLGFTMATYLAACGVDRTDPINESVGLIERYADFFDTPEQLSGIVERFKQAYGVTALDVMEVRDPKWTNRVRWIDSAKVQLSARRIHTQMMQNGVAAIRDRVDSEGDGSEYRLYSEMTSVKSEQQPELSRDELRELLERARSRGAHSNIARQVTDRVLRSGIFDQIDE